VRRKTLLTLQSAKYDFAPGIGIMNRNNRGHFFGFELQKGKIIENPPKNQNYNLQPNPSMIFNSLAGFHKK